MAPIATAQDRAGDALTPTSPPIRRLAVVGPTFFSYTEAIAAEFARRDIAVTMFDEKRSNRNLAKIRYRLSSGAGVDAAQHRHLQDTADKIVAAGIEHVLLVGVEVVDRAMVQALVAHGIAVHLYMWDGRANKGRFQSYLDLLHGRATFDLADAGDLAMDYVPLFAEPTFHAPEPAIPSSDLGFCGTMHSDRVAAIAGLLRAPWADRLKLDLKLYYHSRLLFALKSLAQPIGLRLLPRITSRQFPKSEVAAMFQSSRYVLDIAHPGQSGLTARTFETLLSGARLLTMNTRAAEALPPSFRDRVVVVAAIEDARDIDWAPPPLPPLTAEQRYYLSLERFADELLAIMRRPARALPGESGSRPAETPSQGAA